MTCIYESAGYEIMSAPNRYRKLFAKGPVFTEPDADLRAEASEGVRLLCAEGTDGFDAARAAALEMQKSDWPEKADRALGVEPHFNLCDIILLWRRA